jgi:NAD-dependent deacetylase
MDGTFEIAKEAVKAARRLVILTGAGISVASGVSTYVGSTSSTRFLRSVTNARFEENPREVWRQHLELRADLARREPNPAHLAITKAAIVHPNVVLTQNIDGLHERSGHPYVFPLHGSLWQNRCTMCGEERDDETLAYPDGLPLSPCCQALERPSIVWFGDCLKENILMAAKMALEACDVLLVVGTSGTVAPVSRFAKRVMDLKRMVIEVNPEPTGYVPCDICLREPAQEMLPLLFST